MHSPPASQTAYHESGHCCVAHLLGRNYGAALHENGGGLAGTGDLTRPAVAADYRPDLLESAYARDALESAFDDAAISAAGVVATAMATGAPVTVLTGPDRVLVEAAGARLCGGDFQAVQHWTGLAMARARSMLSAHWPAVERIAQALEERRRLSADDVAGLMAQAAQAR